MELLKSEWLSHSRPDCDRGNFRLESEQGGNLILFPGLPSIQENCTHSGVEASIAILGAQTHHGMGNCQLREIARKKVLFEGMHHYLQSLLQIPL